MKIVLKDNALFTSLIKTSSDMNSEIELQVDRTGVSCKSFSSNVAVVAWNLAPGQFIHFIPEGSQTLGIKASDLLATLKHVAPADECSLTLEDARLVVTVCEAKTRAVRRRRLPLFEFQLTKMPVKTLACPVVATFNLTVLEEALEECAELSDRVEFESYGGTVFLSTSNDSRGDLKRQVPPIDAPSENCISMFSTEILSNIFSLKKHFKEVLISTGNDWPLSAEFKEEGITVRYVIAPRVKND